MKRKFPVDRTLKKVFDEAEEHFKGRASRDQIKESFYFLWYNTKILINSGVFASILLPKWGRFIPNIVKIKAWHDSIEEGEEKEELKKIADSLEETDNPILIVVTPKD